ncbi:MAG TPA: quinone-dependent dihydroorotate dehydrogenase [Rhizomicrobium sp.]|jgi:dihydroorotate dehydrogenase|nr:quinone-dependent dihydroorotate dehydrogenase [Rhizomicrobium sp.]
MILSAATAFLRFFPAETAHRATIVLTKSCGPLLPTAAADDPRLAVTAFGLSFPNPVGLAAGFDKNADVPAQMARFGFGFVECGTVTPRPQAGNPRPRLFRLAQDRAVINRMGFNNDGVDVVAVRLSAYNRRAVAASPAPCGIVGINIGANKDSVDRVADYRMAFRRLGPLADYVTVNVSSPNTPGLRGLQNKDELTALLAAVIEERSRHKLRTPLLLKIAPDLDDNALDDIAAVADASGIEGLIVSNTTIARPLTLKSPLAKEQGGLSGAPLLEPSTRILREMRARTKLTLIGVGGIASGADAYAKLRAGATLVQLYSALAYEGPDLVTRIKRELLACLARDGFATLKDAVG